MSLDVSLILKKEVVFEANITSNLNKMAAACGIYYACWDPTMINCKKAMHISPMLSQAIILLKAFPEFYRQFNASNNWGTYDDFLPWVIRYSNACLLNPDAKIVAFC
jgi:hypothetical protein